MRGLKIVLLLFILSIPLVGATFYVESITVEDTAVGIGTEAKVADLKEGFFSVEGGNVRFWTDGTSPTSSAGVILYQDNSVRILGINNLLNLKFIRTGSSSTTVRAIYER